MEVLLSVFITIIYYLLEIRKAKHETPYCRSSASLFHNLVKCQRIFPSRYVSAGTEG